MRPFWFALSEQSGSGRSRKEIKSMPPWLRGALVWIAGQIPTILTLAALVGLALWGAANDWKLPHQNSAGKEKEKEGVKETVEVLLDEPGSEGPRSLAARQIKFPSAEAVAKAGVEVKPVTIQTIARYVTANSTIDYEPGRYARLMARATGTVWRLEKEAGDPVKKGEIIALVDAAEVGRAKADFLQSLAQVRLRSATLQQLQSLGESAAVSQRAVRDSDSAVREAPIRLFNDQQALLNLGLRFQLKDVEKMSENELARYMRLLGVPEQVRKEFDPETLTANLLPVASPLGGVVVQRLAALGELQQITQPKPMYIV